MITLDDLRHSLWSAVDVRQETLRINPRAQTLNTTTTEPLKALRPEKQDGQGHKEGDDDATGDFRSDRVPGTCDFGAKPNN